MLFHRMLGLVGAVLFAGPAFGADPKVPDLSELREAVATADGRGENVNAIRGALKDFEKALAKGTIRPGEAPPELVALREAVELTSRKGESVEAIAKELGQIEKALTGRAYERPRPPEPKPEPEPPPLRRPGGFGRERVGGGGIVIGPVAGFNARSITISNGAFTIKARQGAVSFEITGSINGNDTKFVITDGEKKIEADDLKKVPEDYRPAAERLLGSIRRP